MMSSKVLTAFFMLELYTIYMLDRCLLFLSACGRGITVNEFSNAEAYKYLYQAELVKSEFDESKV